MPLASSQLLVPLLPIWAGISFSAIGIAYQFAARRKVPPLRVFLLLALCGTAFFAIKCATAGGIDFSLRALLLGLIAGLTQYASIKLVGRAMHLGPFSLVWCMLSLNFAPVVLYAATVQGAYQPWTQWVAVAAAVLCCILASAGHGSDSPTVPSPRARLAYGLLLIAILFVNALPNVAIQDLNKAAAHSSLNLFFLCMYAGIALASFIDALVARELTSTIRRAWFPGLLAGLGSSSGMLSLGLAATQSGPAAFLICSMVTLILPMMAAVLVFHERATPRWIGTLVLGLIAIALANFT